MTREEAEQVVEKLYGDVGVSLKEIIDSNATVGGIKPHQIISHNKL